MNLNTYFLRVGIYNPNSAWIGAIVVPTDSRLTNVMVAISSPGTLDGGDTLPDFGGVEHLLLQKRVAGETYTDTDDNTVHLANVAAGTSVGGTTITTTPADFEIGPYTSAGGGLVGVSLSFDASHNFASGEILGVEGDGACNEANDVWLDFVFTMVV